MDGCDFEDERYKIMAFKLFYLCFYIFLIRFILLHNRCRQRKSWCDSMVMWVWFWEMSRKGLNILFYDRHFKHNRWKNLTMFARWYHTHNAKFRSSWSNSFWVIYCLVKTKCDFVNSEIDYGLIITRIFWPIFYPPKMP